MYQLQPLTNEEMVRWDELIAPYQTRDLFHRRAWLDYLAASRGVQMRQWAIREGARTLGYFCGGILRKGPFRILGSPLKSWGTNFMGPVANGDLDPGALLEALDRLARAERVAMAELEQPALGEEAFAAAEYEPVRGWTYLVSLTPDDPDQMWRALDSTCRNRVRKATKAGLVVEDTDDPAIAGEFYDQYVSLMRRKGLVPPYPRHYPRLLVEHLKKLDLLFALRVRDSDGRVLATGLFPHDERTVYFWGGASWQDGRDLCPNELLHWSAMSMAAARGLRCYNMCGYGRFKKKFGGRLVVLTRWHKCYWRSARWARRAYALYFDQQMRLRGWVRAKHAAVATALARGRPERVAGGSDAAKVAG